MTAKKASVADETEKIAKSDESETVNSTEKEEDSWPGRFDRLARLAKKRPPGNKSHWSGKVGAVLLAMLVVASLAVVAGLYWFQYRYDRDTDAAAAKAAITAASDGTVAILSYSPDTLDHDFDTARSHLTGDFLSYYDNFTKQIVAPAAKQKAVKTTAVVLRGALTEFHPESAVVLLFINQSTQSKDKPEPTMTSSSVIVTMTKADGKWLISQFNPA